MYRNTNVGEEKQINNTELRNIYNIRNQPIITVLVREP